MFIFPSRILLYIVQKRNPSAAQTFKLSPYIFALVGMVGFILISIFASQYVLPDGILKDFTIFLNDKPLWGVILAWILSSTYLSRTLFADLEAWEKK